MNERITIEIPITDRARKYGYVIWKKRHDDQMRGVLGDVTSVDLSGDVVQLGKQVDWNQRRISITYTTTRGLPGSVTRFRLRRVKRGKLELRFR